MQKRTSLLRTERERAVFAIVEAWIREHGEPPATRGDNLDSREGFVSMLTMCLGTEPTEEQLLHLLAAGGEPHDWDAVLPLARRLLAFQHR